MTETKVFLDPGLSGPAGVSNVDLTTLARDAAHAHCHQVMPILQRSQKARSLLLREANIDIASETAVTVRTFGLYYVSLSLNSSQPYVSIDVKL